MGSAGQLVRSSRRRAPSHRRDGQPVLPLRAQWAVAIVAIACRSTLSTIVALLLWGVLPGLVGFHTTTVMSGSMAPRLQVGDAVVVRSIDAAALAPGEVLLFDDPDHAGRLRMHRLVEVLGDGRLVTKGDANEDRDSSTVAFRAVRGAAFLRIPFAGLPNFWFRTGQPLPLVAGAALVALLAAGVRLGRLLDDPEERARRRHRGVRLRGLHRAAAAGVTLVVLSGTAAAQPSPAVAAYSATTASTGNTWATACGDVVPAMLGPSPSLYWGYGGAAGGPVADLTGQGDVGGLLGDATPTTCSGGAGPSLVVGGSGGGAVVEQTARSYPGDTTVATWFRTTTPGGTLADFGIARTGASSTMDKVLYMRSDGNLSFGAFTQSLVNLTLGSLTCTTTSATGYADGAWHVVVATYGDAVGCTITVDGGAPVTQAPPYTLKALTGFSGYWRFGGDTARSDGWAGATAQNGFIGGLDESQVYAAVLSPAARGAIVARGR